MSETVGEDSGPRIERSQSRLWRYGPLIVWMSAIFLASTDGLSGSHTAAVIEPLLRWLFPHISSHRIDLIHLLVRKGAHFSEYAILALLARRAFITSSYFSLRRLWFAASLCLIVLYALSDEYHQSFVPTRTASIYDSMIDISGGLTVLLLLVLWKTAGRRTVTRARNSLR